MSEDGDAPFWPWSSPWSASEGAVSVVGGAVSVVDGAVAVVEVPGRGGGDELKTSS